MIRGEGMCEQHSWLPRVAKSIHGCFRGEQMIRIGYFVKIVIVKVVRYSETRGVVFKRSRREGEGIV